VQEFRYSVFAAYRVEFTRPGYVLDTKKENLSLARHRTLTLRRQIEAIFVLTIAGHTLDHLVITPTAWQIHHLLHYRHRTKPIADQRKNSLLS